MARPLLGDVELQHVQQIEIDGDQVLVEHGVPALEGDFLQGLGRRGMQVTLAGVLTGPEAGQGLKALRDKFRAAAPVSFVADITTATRVDQVLIEEMGVRELAGKPERFEYAFTLREYTPAPEPERRVPPPPPQLPTPLTSTLVVTVIVEGEPDFDHDETRVTVEGQQQEDGARIEQPLTNRQENVWTEEEFPPGSYTVTATPADPGLTPGSKPVEVRQGQTAEVEIRLRRGKNNAAKAFIVHFWFDKAFIEPCMRAVMRQVAQYAGSHADEKLVIVGHTDESGPEAYNQALSERRGRSAYAYLTYKLDPQGSVAEWDELRKARTQDVQRTVRDTWGTREYQHMLQDLGHYPGNVNGNHDDQTDQAVRAFQAKQGLTVDGIVGDQTWPVLINEYMAQDNLAVAEERFLANGQEVLKWLGCGEKMPLPSTPGREPASDPNEPPPPPGEREPAKPSCGDPAWRPNRRTELLFVKDDALPCQVPEPVTFRLPPGRPAGTQWSLGPGSAEGRCCFLTRDAKKTDRWLVQPAEPEKVLVKGSIKFEDGRPLANAKYLLIAPDGEFMNGEQVCRPKDKNKPGKGHGLPGRTDADGDFTDDRHNKHYLKKPKGVGVYTLELQGPYVARLKGAPLTEAKGNVVCKRLDGSSDFDAIVCQAATTFDLHVSGAAQTGGPASTTFLAIQSTSGDVIITTVFPTGTCAAPHSITWTGGEEVPGNPLQRRVSRSTIGQTAVSATMPASGVTKSVTIAIITVQLEAMKFNHDSTSATIDALNIRKNATESVTVPEWQRGTSVHPPEDSPVAYAIRETQGNTITIQAQFQLTGPGTLTGEVRAVAPMPHVLGEVRVKQVSLSPNGATNFETFELQNVQIWSAGIGVRNITWNWQVRLQSADPWTDFATSQHRIYTVLEVPKSPWQQTPFPHNTQLPWTEVLEYACDWASGKTDLDSAATEVTRRIYGLGSSILEYDCPGGGGTHYAFPDFNCTAFLERLRGGTGAGRYVNCSDCATIVSTFANILGCDLWQSRMGNGFDLNPILGIGSSTWQTACGWSGFSYHEVAWKGACTSSEEVFDACLQVDGDIDPTAPPHTPHLPANLRFGNTGDGQYRDRLAADTPTGRPNCQPRPGTRTRRQIV